MHSPHRMHPMHSSNGSLNALDALSIADASRVAQVEGAEAVVLENAPLAAFDVRPYLARTPHPCLMPALLPCSPHCLAALLSSLPCAPASCLPCCLALLAALLSLASHPGGARIGPCPQVVLVELDGYDAAKDRRADDLLTAAGMVRQRVRRRSSTAPLPLLEPRSLPGA